MRHAICVHQRVRARRQLARAVTFCVCLQLWMRNLGLTPGSSAKRKSGPLPASTPSNGSAADGAQTPADAAANGTPAATAATADGSNGEAAAAAGDQAGSSGVSAARAAAAAALAAAKEAATGGVGRSYNKVTITETRRFAGKDLQVCCSSSCAQCWCYNSCLGGFWHRASRLASALCLLNYTLNAQSVMVS